jgi:transcriptional regulator GlxA family with amidase domain
VDEGDVLTSAGSAAGIDACLHIVRSDYCAAIANHFRTQFHTTPTAYRRRFAR